MTFSEWLGLQVNRPDPVGDLARDAAEDPHWPEAGPVGDYEEHLAHTSDFILDVLGEAWNEYREEAPA